MLSHERTQFPLVFRLDVYSSLEIYLLAFDVEKIISFETFLKAFESHEDYSEERKKKM